MGLFFSQPQFPVFKLPAPPSASIDIMSVYQPFPLRVDSFGEQGKQYDACFQIGEFPGKNVRGTGIVILVPLKVSTNPGVGGQFVNAFASKIPNILGAQPDPLQGYPDVPAQTGASWDVSKAVDVTRAYYTWANGDGTRIIVMAEPLLIAQADMTNIQRLPVTPPEDVIHEIGTPILYHPAPPRDANGNPVPCPPTQLQKSVSNVVQPPVVTNKPNVNSNLLLEVLLGMIGILTIIIGVWFGVKLAAGPVGDRFKALGESLGRSLAGGYGVVKKGTSNILGLGPGTGKPFPARRSSTGIPASVMSEKDIESGKKRRDALLARRNVTRRNPRPPSPTLTLRTPPPSPPRRPPSPGLTLRTPPPSPPRKPEPVAFAPSPRNESKDQFVERMRRTSPPGSPKVPGQAAPRAQRDPAGTGIFGGKRKRRRRNRMKTGRKA